VAAATAVAVMASVVVAAVTVAIVVAADSGRGDCGGGGGGLGGELRRRNAAAGCGGGGRRAGWDRGRQWLHECERRTRPGQYVHTERARAGKRVFEGWGRRAGSIRLCAPTCATPASKGRRRPGRTDGGPPRRTAVRWLPLLL